MQSLEGGSQEQLGSASETEEDSVLYLALNASPEWIKQTVLRWAWQDQKLAKCNPQGCKIPKLGNISSNCYCWENV